MHATLVDSALVAYQRFVTAERQRFCDESCRSARLFGIPARCIPASEAAFRAYMRDMLRGPTLTVGRDARSIAAVLLSPPLPPPLRQLAGAARGS